MLENSLRLRIPHKFGFLLSLQNRTEKNNTIQRVLCQGLVLFSFFFAREKDRGKVKRNKHPTFLLAVNVFFLLIDFFRKKKEKAKHKNFFLKKVF